MDKKDEDDAFKELVLALSRTDDSELIEDFLRSLLTDNEVYEVSSRWALVKLIDSGITQRQISRDLGLSLCKITRGSKELKKEDSSFRKMLNLVQQ
ncbi:MAG: transcriptional regulator [Spirochaetaceae bacterium]|nr:transcriptional regulator [Spirochaetaceae bacterium]